MVVSRDLQEVSVLECILGSLHIGVDVESEPERARVKLAKSKIDALIIDFDLVGATGFLNGLQNGHTRNAVPLIIVSGSTSNPRAHRSYFKNPSRSNKPSTLCRPPAT
jgi:DNA-binding response OmpR family regulator